MADTSTNSTKSEFLSDPVPLDSVSQDTLRSKLECPVCMEISLPPIALCTIGHSVCGMCRERTQKCPTCRGPFSTARNYALEGVVALMEINCRNSGCTELLNIESLEEHLLVCEYRPVVCALGGCQNKLIEFSQFLQHLVQIHTRKIRLTAPWYDLYCCRWDATIFDEKFKGACLPQPLIQDGTSFMVNLEVEFSTMFVWISGMLTQEDASKYLVELQLEDNARFSAKTMQWTLGLVPIHKDRQNVKYSLDSATIPLRTLRSYSEMSESSTRYTFSMKLRIYEKTKSNTAIPNCAKRQRVETNSMSALMGFLGLGQ